jgi:hypothetical protein
MPKKLAGFLLLVVLYAPGSAHLFPASESTKSAATAQPAGTFHMAIACQGYHIRSFAIL